jgi:hypothetical protein
MLVVSRKGGTVVRALAVLVAIGQLVWSAAAASSEWKIELIDQSGTGLYTSIRMDNHGNAHVSYTTDTEEHALRYAFWDHALKRWFVMTVANGANFSALTLDSKQRPHISWADYGTSIGSKLRYARWDGAAWKIEAIPLNSEVIDFYTSIALDQNDYPTLSFYEYRGPRGTDIAVRMRVVQWNGQYWQALTIDGQNQSGKYNALVTDSQGRVHLAYANVGAQSAAIRYALRDRGNWNVEGIEDIRDGGKYMGAGACVAVDKNDNPHIVYANNSDRSIRYAVRNDKHWALEKVADIGRPVYADRYAIALTEDGIPYVGYYDGGSGELRVAWRQGSQWRSETVDVGGAGFTSSMSIHDGQIWVSYSDQSIGGVKVAHRALNGTPAGGVPKAAPPAETAGKIE